MNKYEEIIQSAQIASQIGCIWTERGLPTGFLSGLIVKAHQIACMVVIAGKVGFVHLPEGGNTGKFSFAESESTGELITSQTSSRYDDAIKELVAYWES